ncbi:hypothetical protein D9M72_652840 [compost metagenome]
MILVVLGVVWPGIRLLIPPKAPVLLLPVSGLLSKSPSWAWAAANGKKIASKPAIAAFRSIKVMVNPFNP